MRPSSAAKIERRRDRVGQRAERDGRSRPGERGAVGPHLVPAVRQRGLVRCIWEEGGFTHGNLQLKTSGGRYGGRTGGAPEVARPKPAREAYRARSGGLRVRRVSCAGAFSPWELAAGVSGRSGQRSAPMMRGFPPSAPRPGSRSTPARADQRRNSICVPAIGSPRFRLVVQHQKISPYGARRARTTHGTRAPRRRRAPAAGGRLRTAAAYSLRRAPSAGRRDRDAPTPASSRTRPRAVRWISPLCTRNGSYASSIVSVSSPTHCASVVRPTGWPPKRCTAWREWRGRPCRAPARRRRTARAPRWPSRRR